MQYAEQYPDAIKRVKNKRYTQAAGFMMKGILERIVRRVSTQQRANLTRTIARRLRNTHARILLAQKRGMALRVVAEQAYKDVQAEMERQLGIEPQGAVSPVLAGE